jgi:hypothetical protein
VTAQVHERLILDGIETSMAFCPLVPERHRRVKKRKRGTSPEDSGFFSTACWRRYRGSWEIRSGRFYLTGLEGRMELMGSETLFAEWFTGILRVPRGELLHYVHMGFGSVYEEEVHIRIRRGLVLGTRVIDNRTKSHDPRLLGWRNLPGLENRFDGDSPPSPAAALWRWVHRLLG